MTGPAGSVRAAIEAAAVLGTEDRSADYARTPSEIVLTSADRSGHPRTTTHPATYGYCRIVDGARDEILAAYNAHRWEAVR